MTRKCDSSTSHSEDSASFCGRLNSLGGSLRLFTTDGQLLRKSLLRKQNLRRRVRLRTFRCSRMTLPYRDTSSMYFQGLGSSPKPVKLLKVLDMGELARSHSTTELLPLDPKIIQHLRSASSVTKGSVTAVPLRKFQFNLLRGLVQAHDSKTANLSGPHRLGLWWPARSGLPLCL
jgi:hypothetical protein